MYILACLCSYLSRYWSDSEPQMHIENTLIIAKSKKIMAFLLVWSIGSVLDTVADY